MIRVDIIKPPFIKDKYQAVISDDKGHRAETLIFPYGKIKNGLKKKGIDLPAFKMLQFNKNFVATVIIEGRTWGRETPVILKKRTDLDTL